MNNEGGVSKTELQYIRNAEKADQAIEKLTGKLVERDKTIEDLKAKLAAAETGCKKETEAHEITKKSVVSPEDYLFLHSAKMDNIVTPILEGNNREDVFVDSKDLAKLKIDPIIHDTVHSEKELKTSNLKLEKLTEPNKEEKTIKISSLHKK